MQTGKQKLIIAFIFIIFLFIALVVFLSFKNAVLKEQPVSPTISPFPGGQAPIISPYFKQTDQIPTLSPQRGGGVDTSSQVVLVSIREINKLSSFIPYVSDVTLSTGIPVSIVIPGEDLQTNPWELAVYINNIDYNVSSGDPDYALMRQSFIEASDIVLSKIKENGADPGKIYITWGDKAYIRNQAEEWLRFSARSVNEGE